MNALNQRLVGVEDVRAAAARIAGQVLRTPTVASPALSRITGCELSLKLENMQVTGSFKPRGAVNTLAQLTQDERSRGVAGVSAGNHAQGLAYAAGRLSVPATVLMPASAPRVKVERTRALGARVVIAGETFDDAAAALPAFRRELGLTLVHPFDDDRVIAGQGTVALEMLEDVDGFDAVVVAIGGGGLASGVATVVRALSPRTEVQGERYAAMAAAVGRWDRAGAGGPTIAEGMAARAVSPRTAAYIRELVDDVVVVTEDAVAAALRVIVREARTVVEGSGAAPLAAVLADPTRFANRRVSLVLCGGNIDDDRLCSLLSGRMP